MKKITILFPVLVLLLLTSCKKEGAMDKKYLLTTDNPVITGVLEFSKVMEEGENAPEQDMHVMICLLKPDSPVVFWDEADKEIKAGIIQLTGSKAPMPLAIDYSRAEVKAVYYKKHAKSHHAEVIADVISVKKAE